MAFTLYLLAALGGVFAGFITTLAGLGSVLTLYILIDVLGLDADVANGTNRIGIMAMCITALPSFHKKGHLQVKKSWPIIATIFTGAMMGLALALNVDNKSFKIIFKYLLFVMLFMALVNPSEPKNGANENHTLNWFIALPVFLTIGFYAGFIQAGTGVFMVISLAMIGRYSLLDANGIKLATFSLYSLVAIVLFAWTDKIDWGVGLALAIGQGIGAYVTARVATSYPKANVYVRYLLIIVILLAIVRMFELHNVVANWID